MTAPTSADHPPRDGKRRRAPAPVGRLVLGALLVLLGLAWLLDAAGALDLRWQMVLPGALLLVGLALLATAPRGGHGGLVAAGIVLSILVLISATVPLATPFEGVGDRTERPTTVGELDRSYALGAGSLTVDLRDLDLAGQQSSIEARVGAGELIVRVPEGVAVDVLARAGAGEVNLAGRARGGVGVSVSDTLEGQPGAGELSLDLAVGLGQVEVRR